MLRNSAAAVLLCRLGAGAVLSRALTRDNACESNGILKSCTRAAFGCRGQSSCSAALCSLKLRELALKIGEPISVSDDAFHFIQPLAALPGPFERAHCAGPDRLFYRHRLCVEPF